MCVLFDILGLTVDWIESYLSQRTRVILDGKQSQWIPVLSGVPECSILGPHPVHLLCRWTLTLPITTKHPACHVKKLNRINSSDDARALQSTWTVLELGLKHGI